MTRQAVVADALQNLLGPDFGIGVTDPTEAGGGLWPQETPAIAKAVRKRRLEFTAGRVAARQAMAELGLPPQPVLQAPDRAPLWPTGMIGSIAHCDRVCIAAIALSGTARSIGIDIEPDTALPADLEQIICTPNERRWLDRHPLADRDRLAKLIFSCKESVYKAQYPLTGEMIGFEMVEIQPDLARHSFLALPSKKSVFGRLSGQFAFAGGFILTCYRIL
ncbi:4'-phosphopantetheinyl transferase family protein [Roseovarius sp. Pro17]|uniref:4'-phosphopantetheinyl transferase family protein n=1 Tax=Roseovarius sp. Pro17 TaxID=3108175 RepID=UPI002D784FB5|nr:4'-phosphopantetheinyl transferase superfamily protein [Roseovarius sp. Pro17]